MASKQPDSPWTSSTFLPFSPLARRGSVTSLSSRTGVDKEVLSQALDDIHASASRTSGLTAFNEFAPPPSSANSSDRGLVGNLVPTSLGGIYARFKSSVGATKDRPSPSRPSRSRKRSSLGYELANPSTPLQSPDRADSLRPTSLTPSRHSPLETDAHIETPTEGQVVISSSGTDIVTSDPELRSASAHHALLGESFE